MARDVEEASAGNGRAQSSFRTFLKRRKQHIHFYLGATSGDSVKLEKCEMNFLKEIKMRQAASHEKDQSDQDMDEPSPAKRSKEDGPTAVSMYRFFMDMRDMGNTVHPAFKK